METELIDALLAVRPRLTGGELSVALARAAGHTTNFDMQRATGMKKHRIDAAIEGLCTKCAPLCSKYLNILTTNSSAQNVQTYSPPTHVLNYLLKSIDRTLPPHPADYKGFDKAYPIAYKYAKRNHHEALLLLKDVIDTHGDDFRKANFPGSWLPRITESYLSAMPPMTKDELENQRVIGKRLRWNPKTNLREIVR